jgi:adenylyltransferase/sulfurtransferase
MSRTPFERPRILSNYQVWCEPPDEAGDEVLRFVSGMRSLKLKGHSFREFTRRVVPLLDGKHTWGEIQEQAAGVFWPRAWNCSNSRTSWRTPVSCRTAR